MDETAYRPPEKLRTMPTWLLNRAAATGDRLVSAELAKDGLRKHHYSALLTLAEVPGLSQAALGRRIGLDVSDVHAVVSDLEERGLLVRSRDSADRRRNTISLSPAGHRETARLEARLLAVQEQLLAPLSANARRQLLAALGTLATDSEPRREGE